MTVTATFNLTAVVREHLATTDESDPRAIAAEIIDGLSPDEIREALTVALPTVVRTQIGDSRRAAAAGANPGSAKWDAVATVVAGRDVFTERLCGADGEWKFLGEFTAADLLARIDEHKRNIEANQRWLGRCEALLGALKSSHKTTVADLGRSRVERIFYA